MFRNVSLWPNVGRGLVHDWSLIRKVARLQNCFVNFWLPCCFPAWNSVRYLSQPVGILTQRGKKSRSWRWRCTKKTGAYLCSMCAPMSSSFQAFRIVFLHTCLWVPGNVALILQQHSEHIGYAPDGKLNHLHCLWRAVFALCFLNLICICIAPRLPFHLRHGPHTLFHTQLCHTLSFTHNFHTHTPSFTHNSVTHSLSHTLSFTHNFVTHSLSHTTFTHTHHLSHTLSFTHNFVTHSLSHTTFTHTIFHTHSLSHTTLSHTLFHTQLSHTPSFTHTLFHTQLCHTLSSTHNFVTHSLSHTTLSHTLFHTQLSHTPSFTHTLFHTQLLDPPPPPLSFLSSSSRYNICCSLLEEVDLWGFLVLSFCLQCYPCWTKNNQNVTKTTHIEQAGRGQFSCLAGRLIRISNPTSIGVRLEQLRVLFLVMLYQSTLADSGGFQLCKTFKAPRLRAMPSMEICSGFKSSGLGIKFFDVRRNLESLQTPRFCKVTVALLALWVGLISKVLCRKYAFWNREHHTRSWFFSKLVSTPLKITAAKQTLCN